MSDITLDQVMEARFTVDAAIDIMVAKHKAEMAPLQAEIQEYEHFIQDHLIQQNMTKLSTTAGTAYFKNYDSATVQDFEALLEQIKAEGLWHMLEKKVSKLAVREYAEKNNGALPVGVKYETGRKVHFLRGKST